MRETYQTRLESQFRQLEAQLNALQARAHKVKLDNQKDYVKYLEILRARQDKARARLQALRDAGDESWEEQRASTDEALSDLKNAITTTECRFD